MTVISTAKAWIMCVLRTYKLTSHSFSFISVNYHLAYQARLEISSPDFVFSPCEAEHTGQTSLCIDWQQDEKERMPFLLSTNEPQLFPYLGPKQRLLPPNAELTVGSLVTRDLTRG